MPTWIMTPGVFANNAQQNASTSVGETNMGGWDANMKFNTAQGATFGFFNFVYGLHTTVDNMEGVDGAIVDMDVKPIWNVNL